VRPVRADLGDPAGLAEALADVAPAFVAITAWTRQETEAENIRVNGGAVRDLLAALSPAGSLEHVALMTGLKHYLGPFEAYGQGEMPDTPFHEDEERLPYPNFYYAQEDELFAAAERDGFTWSVHRSHTVFGFATGNAMNMVATLCAYASLCREQGRPFVFPGSEKQWNALTDVTDADLLAEQMTWAARTPVGRDQAFNTANGDVFRWRWLWPQIAAWFELEWEGYADGPRTLETAMAGAEPLWRDLAAKHGLVEPDLSRVASWWHSDADLGREMEVVTDMNKSRTAGFSATRDTRATFFAYAEQYRKARVIP
jgi:nucleoside-diphosphate-sugar epimerase